jgi:hypothetical protein
MLKIVVISDTHRSRWEDIPLEMKKAVAEADWAIHCGDYTGKGVMEGMRRHARRFIGVCGNTDVGEIHHSLPAKQVLEVEGKKIGITHPVWGGPPFHPEELLAEFDHRLDALLFGHLHETWNRVWRGVLLFSPGQGYPAFGTPATMGILTIDRGEIKGEIKLVR